MTITRKNLIEKHNAWRQKRIDFVEYYELNVCENVDLFSRHTHYYTYTVDNEKDLYFRNKAMSDASHVSHQVQCGNVLFIINSNVPLGETAILINRYYEAKINGNVRTFRLD